MYIYRDVYVQTCECRCRMTTACQLNPDVYATLLPHHCTVLKILFLHTDNNHIPTGFTLLPVYDCTSRILDAGLPLLIPKNSALAFAKHTLFMIGGADDFPKPSLGRMLRGGGTTLNSYGNDHSPWFAERRRWLPKTTWGWMLRGGGMTLNSWGNDRSPWFAETRQ